MSERYHVQPGGEGIRGPWEELRKAPFLRVGIGFMVGVLLGRLTHSEVSMSTFWWALCTTLSLISLFALGRRTGMWSILRRYRMGLLICWALTSGILRQAMDQPAADPVHFIHDQSRGGIWLVMIDHLNGTSDKVFRADATVRARMADSAWVPFTGRVMLTLLRDTPDRHLRPGDVVAVNGMLEPIERVADPGGFDRAGWAASKGIHHEIFVGPGAWIAVRHEDRWTDLFAKARERVGEWLVSSGLTASERALVRALVLGQRDELEAEVNQAFVRSGTVHVLAVSGMHVGLIYILLAHLFSGIGKGRWAGAMRMAAVLLCLWAYVGITGGSPSVLRAASMFSLFALAQLIGRRPSSLNALMIAGVVLLAYDPGMLVQASFQLSFLAVLGILLFLRPIQALWSPKPWLLKQIWSLVAVSLAAQVFTTPISLVLFKAFPMWFLPANVVVVTAMTLAIYLALAYLVLQWVPFLSAALIHVLSLLLRVATSSAMFIADLPGAYPALRIDTITAVLLYALVISVAIWTVWRWRSARTVTLVLIVVVLARWSVHASASHDRFGLVVYDDRKQLLLAVLQGRELFAFSEADADSILRMKTERHARHFGLEGVSHRSLEVLYADTLGHGAGHSWGRGLVAGPSGTVLLLKGRVNKVQAFPCDVLLFHDLRWVDTAALRPLRDVGDQVVLAGNIRWGQREAIRAWAADHGKVLHEVRSGGAFIR